MKIFNFEFTTTVKLLANLSVKCGSNFSFLWAPQSFWWSENKTIEYLDCNKKKLFIEDHFYMNLCKIYIMRREIIIIPWKWRMERLTLLAQPSQCKSSFNTTVTGGPSAFFSPSFFFFSFFCSWAQTNIYIHMSKLNRGLIEITI